MPTAVDEPSGGQFVNVLRSRLSLPVFCAPMFLCSSADLASECCKAGIIGSLPAGQYRNVEEFEHQLGIVRENLTRHYDRHSGMNAGPLAVNISVTRDMADFRRQATMARDYGAEIIISSVTDPTPLAPVIHDLGMLHFHDVTSIRFAEKAAAAGVDGMIAIGAGGGGHAGTISHLALIPAIRAIFDGAVVMAGAVSTGAVVRAAEVLGADLAYMGTRFIATRESSAPEAYKQMLVESGVEDVLYTRGVNGMPASWLKKSLYANGLDPDNLFIPDRRGTDHLPDGCKPWRDIWSGGQGVGLIHDIPTTRSLIRKLLREYIDACNTPDLAVAAERAAELLLEPAGELTKWGNCGE